MKSEIIYDQSHRWIVMGRDPEKPNQIIDTNQYMIVHKDHALILDPGGIEVFAPMLGAVVKHVALENIRHLFASHQDPDIISSLGMWDRVLPDAQLHSPAIWEGFIAHFGIEHIKYVAIADQGGTIDLNGLQLDIIPAHYLHSSANFHIYDKTAKIFFSGDVGAVIEPVDAPIFVDNIASHLEKMRYFHQRWMPSNRAKLDWINRVRQLDIEMMLPQHGRILRGDEISQFLDWFEALDVGIAIAN